VISPRLFESTLKASMWRNEAADGRVGAARLSPIDPTPIFLINLGIVRKFLPSRRLRSRLTPTLAGHGPLAKKPATKLRTPTAPMTRLR
jgi:hypothetical protein